MVKTDISVVIPVLNEEKIIARLLAQLTEIPGLEVIVSDGGSIDRTAEICRRFSCQLVSGSSGRGRQLNAGAEAAKGELLLFLHADSQVTAGLFQQLAGLDGALWGGCTLAFDDQAAFFRAVAWGSHLRAAWGGIIYGDQGIFCCRELFFQLGGFPELALMEDLAFSRRMKKIARPVILPTVIISSARRFRQGGPWKTLLKMQLIKALYDLGLSPAILAKIYRSKEQR